MLLGQATVGLEDRVDVDARVAPKVVRAQPDLPQVPIYAQVEHQGRKGRIERLDAIVEFLRHQLLGDQTTEDVAWIDRGDRIAAPKSTVAVLPGDRD
jgi:hypothetical protein